MLDILKAIELCEVFMQGMESFFEYEKDLKTKSAVERQIAIISEAVNELKKEDSEITIENSIQIVGLRNRLIHAYDSTEDTIIWAILQRHLPNLKEETEKLLKNLN